ncbi:uncharacterized protein LOC117180195 [Belonocnema kinseyi]|uniref:uncharacterized protein LOC117180195 n=1 Tax=Belonocnema kinseyi TaxID=2817044 RepID=UPI00143D98B7|nr:uncharacterized protein LOC117180195 [Belonocnema kinseyi]
MSRILNCLPAKFDHFHAAWESVTEVDNTFANLRDRLQQEEIRLQSRESSVIENALIGKGNFSKSGKGQHKKGQQSSGKKLGQSSQPGQSGQSVIKCYKCDQVRHRKYDCDNKPCAKYIEYCKKNYKCNICQEIRHFTKECPKRSNDDKSKYKSFISVALSSAALEYLSDSNESSVKDSVATHHMTGNLKWMTNLRSLDTAILVKIGDSRKLPAVAIGDVHLHAYDSKQWYTIVLKNVLFVPNLEFNLFSVTSVLDRVIRNRLQRNCISLWKIINLF